MVSMYAYVFPVSCSQIGSAIDHLVERESFKTKNILLETHNNRVL